MGSNETVQWPQKHSFGGCPPPLDEDWGCSLGVPPGFWLRCWRGGSQFRHTFYTTPSLLYSNQCWWPWTLKPAVKHYAHDQTNNNPKQSFASVSFLNRLLPSFLWEKILLSAPSLACRWWWMADLLAVQYIQYCTVCMAPCHSNFCKSTHW